MIRRPQGGGGGSGGKTPKYSKLTITFIGQTAFTISENVTDVATSILTLDGIKQEYGVDYTILGTVLTWISSIILDPSLKLEIYHFV